MALPLAGRDAMTVDLPPGATGVIDIDLDALAANWQALAGLVTPAECAAVVKADAYGLGAAEVIPALMRAGCRTFFIATPEEALEARELAPGADLFALDGLLPGAAEGFIAANVTPVLASVDEVREWAALALQRDEHLAAALQVDTGLHRLGLSASDVKVLAGERLLDGLDVVLLMSHLASADAPTDAKNAEQRAAFERMRAEFPGVRASLAASDGLMLGPAYHYDLVRPGYALYGGQASQAGTTPVVPVVRVRARVLQVRDVAPGESVGYSASWRAERASRIAVIAAGYDDGLARALSRATGVGGSHVGFAGTLAPIVGRVSMDLITVDVTDLERPPVRGDLVDLVGPGLSIESVGASAGTIGYEILTRLGPRFARLYRGGGA